MSRDFRPSHCCIVGESHEMAHGLARPRTNGDRLSLRGPLHPSEEAQIIHAQKGIEHRRLIVEARNQITKQHLDSFSSDAQARRSRADRVGNSKKKPVALIDAGILAIEDVPGDFEVSDKQRNQVVATKTGQPVVERAAIAAFLGAMQYPIASLDYEMYPCAFA